QYHLESTRGHDLGALRAIQDWYIRYHLAGVKDVAEVAGIGGFRRQIQVAASSHKMKAAGVSLSQVKSAIEAANGDVGGGIIEENGLEIVVHGRGLLLPPNAVRQLEETVIVTREETPVRIMDVAEVSIGGSFRRGVLEVNGREVVGGIVVMRRGADAAEVTGAVREKIRSIEAGLPAGVSIKSFYDRSQLIGNTVDTVWDALWKEILLVTLVHVFFLWHFRSVLIVTLPLPLSILGAFVCMKVGGVNSNLMSLGGIAIAIGVLVDAGIVMAENVRRRVEEGTGELSTEDRTELVRTACQQVGRPLVFAMVIVIVGFLPVFLLQGAEGKMFRPLALTKTFAMVISVLLSITLVPALCSLLAVGRSSEGNNAVMRWLSGVYRPLLEWALRRSQLVVIGALLVFMATLVLAVGVPTKWTAAMQRSGWTKFAALADGTGSEFMPRLDEGSLLLMPVMAPGVSLTEVKRVMIWQNEIIRQSPEVLSVAGKLGRADTVTDPAPVEMIETTIQLHPRLIDRPINVLGLFEIPRKVKNPVWRSGMTTEKLVSEWTRKLSELPGFVPGFLQPIENRILMLNTGIRGQLGIKILGDDPGKLQAKAAEISELVREVRGADAVVASRQQGQPYVEVEVDRQAASVHGLSVHDVLETVVLGIGGRDVTTVVAGRERIPVHVRLQRSERTDVHRLGDILVATPNGHHLPLGLLAKFHRTTGPNVLESEDGMLRAYVQMNVRGRDLGGFVEEVKALIRKEVELPTGMTIAYSGQFEDQLRTRKTMWLIVPLAVLLIFMLLLLLYRSAGEAAHVLLAIPFALSGGFLLQWMLDQPFSVAVWVGYIALFGTAIQTTMVMVVYLQQALADERTQCEGNWSEQALLTAVTKGALLRLRPKLMTVVTIIASLVPLMLLDRTGAEVMRPLATPIVGGMVSSLFHVLIVTPVLFLWLHRHDSEAEEAFSAGRNSRKRFRKQR
ncbi:MAG: efflux RND transporter permease subunit, partial [Limisphaerales bacterium]